MRDLFGKSSLIALEALSFTRTLYAFDFDGTLAGIVENPDQARMRPETERLLSRLSNLVPTAVISGRSLKDLSSRFGAPPSYLVGNHGLEGLPSMKKPPERAEAICTAWLERIRRSIPEELLASGVELEDKTYSLAIHYRKSRTKGEARRFIDAIAEALSPRPRVIPGKCVANLIPPGAPHKGIALLELMEKARVKSAFYMGDEESNEDIFELPEARRSRILTVQVGSRSPSSAAYSIKSQDEVDRVLRTLVGFEARS
jgi:trehalose 6-phosphate phosphatase